MIRLSKLADYGTVAMSYMALKPEELHTAPEIAAAIRLAVPTVSKLLKIMGRKGLLVSQRGSKGGYRLAHRPDRITVAQVGEAGGGREGGGSRVSCHGSGAIGGGDMGNAADQVKGWVDQEYRWGFVTTVEADTIPKGLNEDVIRAISARKGEPEFLLERRLKAYRHWLIMIEPKWSTVCYSPIDFQGISYYSAPKSLKDRPGKLDEVDPEVLRTYERLGIPLLEQKRLAGVAVDAVFDSVSVATTYQKELANMGILFCSFSEAVRKYPHLVEKYLGTVVPYNDNFFASLNSAVFTDGSFCYVPPGVRCPAERSPYFRINAETTGQFERTLIIADAGSYVSYLEGCTAPRRDTNQLPPAA